ncbi:MAG: hypothetical protein LC808_04385, partial [Actinobacteria bacterium]|nr:hypothetical protein [Actinomycetota bacterium]
RVERWGSSRAGAQRALLDELRRRRGEGTEVLRPDSRFADAASIWARRSLSGARTPPLIPTGAHVTSVMQGYCSLSCAASCVSSARNVSTVAAEGGALARAPDTSGTVMRTLLSDPRSICSVSS